MYEANQVGDTSQGRDGEEEASMDASKRCRYGAGGKRRGAGAESGAEARVIAARARA